MRFLHVGAFYQAVWTLFSSKTAQNMCLSILGWSGTPSGKHIFGPFSTPFRSENGAFQRAFGAKCSLKMATHSLKTGSERVSEHPQWSRGSSLRKHVFRLLSNPFSVPKSAIRRPFGAKWGLKMGQDGSQTSPKYVFEHPKWFGINFEHFRF